MSALQRFFNAERIRRGWSMRQIAKLSKMSLSKAYAISNGDDNVEFETFENIAAAFNMSPAELATAIGKGAMADDPKRVSIHAALREVPDEQLATVDLMIRGLAVQLTGRRAATGHRDGASIPGSGARRNHEAHTGSADDSADHGGLSTVSPHLRDAFASVLTALKGLVGPGNRLSSAQPLIVG